jgi:hypothetical protein
MTPIRRSIRQIDGTVTIKSRRGPYRSDSISASGRTIVVELHPTHLVLREHGCRQRRRLDYTQLELWAAKLDAEQRRRMKAEERRQGSRRSKRRNADRADRERRRAGRSGAAC